MIDCACVIHGELYSLKYVENLYKGLSKHLTDDVRLHVYTEHDREIPAKFIKHSLEDLGVSGPKRSWWYKTQLFNPDHFSGQLLYFDLDVIIARNIDWITESSKIDFWGVRDFKYLYRPHKFNLNSSIMYFNVEEFKDVWETFKRGPSVYMSRYPGDQDYIETMVPRDRLKFFDEERIRSWRWQLLDGGMNMHTRQYYRPNDGTVLKDTDVLVFHGKPKIHEIDDPVIQKLWDQ